MRLLLRFDSTTVKKPILSKATLKTGALINILRASVGSRQGEIIIDVPDDKAKEVEDFLLEEGVEVIELKRAVLKKEERCVHCGACVSVCPTEALGFDAEAKVIVDESKCVHCGACVSVCPTEALELPRV
ncbi:MAG: 4Fe-4S binding protein [Archaeoglobaceae archaeon]